MGARDREQELETAKAAQAEAHADRALAMLDNASPDEINVANATVAVADQAVNVAEGREGF